MIGRTIGKYRIVGQLGRGGMGTVYEALDTVLGRRVAIKILNAELADTETVERFRREAIALANLNHSGIATIYELFPADDNLLMVMELVRGETLDRISDRMGALLPDHAAYIVDKILSALEHAHRSGIVHRDMKPANIMVTDVGIVKVMDFGVARVRVAEHVDSYMVGTPAYMSPEQVLGLPVDGRADLYSVGVMFYRLLTGALPFTAATAIGMLEKHISATPTPLLLHRAGLPEWCEPIVQRALAKAPGDRFQSAEEFRQVLGTATGIITPDLRHALAIQPVQPEPREELPPATPMVLAPPLAVAGATAAPAGKSSPAAGPASAGAPPATAANAPTVVLGRTGWARRSAIMASIAGALATIGILTTRRLEAPHVVTGADIRLPVPPPPAAAIARPLGLPAITPVAPPPPPADVRPQVSAPPPPASAPAQPSAVTEQPVGDARRAGRPRSERAAANTTNGEPLDPAGRGTTTPARTVAAPFAFDAKVLIFEGAKVRERDCRVVLADGIISVHPKNDDAQLYAVPYARVLSISYSRGRDPLWQGPNGPAPAVRTGGNAFGIFRPPRHWLSLRTTNAQDRFLILRLADEPQMKRASAALEARTGRTTQLVERPEES